MKVRSHIRYISLACAMLLLVFPLFSKADYQYQTLRPGHENKQVEMMQSALALLGFDIKADGKYGRQTEATVKVFQKNNRLQADGLAGYQTLSTLFVQVPQLKNSYQTAGGSAAGASQAENSVPKTASQGLGVSEAMVITGNRKPLNLRSQASWGLNVIGTIPHGATVQLYGTSGAWSQVHYAGRTGWVVSSYLKQASHEQAAASKQPSANEEVESSSQPSAPASIGKASVFTANGKSLNLRNQPSYSGKTILGIPHLANVEIISRHGKWTQVSYKGTRGYVVDSFLVHGKTAASLAEKTELNQSASDMKDSSSNALLEQALVNTRPGRYLNFRSQPTNGNNIIGQIPSGTCLSLVDKGKDWSKVIFEGKEGYVMSSFLRFQQLSAPETNGNQTQTEPVSQPIQPSETQPTTPSEDTAANNAASENQWFTGTLRPGMSGEEVIQLQTRLDALKYPIQITGTYDQQTKNAVASFQSKNGLSTDGIFGEQSARTMESSAVRSYDSAPLHYTTLRIDNKNESVTAMQQALVALGYQLTANGRFDIPTHQAVVGFQQRNSLSITGVADALTQSAIFSPDAKGYDTPISQLPEGEGKVGGPSTGQVQLLHWFNDVKKSASAGQRATIYHPGSGISFTIRFYSMGNHADSEPASWRDTQLMNRAFGTPSWNINTVYVQLPDGRWTLAAMHNRPHLTGAVSGNGFGGHLCIHFLRDTAEVNRNDPDYGASNQRAIRKAWQSMTGETVP